MAHRPRGLATVDLSLLHLPTQRTAEGVSLIHLPKGYMAKPLSKTHRIRLDSENYRRLQRQVLARDGWRCQSLRKNAPVASPPPEIPQSSG